MTSAPIGVRLLLLARNAVDDALASAIAELKSLAAAEQKPTLGLAADRSGRLTLAPVPDRSRSGLHPRLDLPETARTKKR